jgi:hypothetical protein
VSGSGDLLEASLLSPVGKRLQNMLVLNLSTVMAANRRLATMTFGSGSASTLFEGFSYWLIKAKKLN